MSEQADQLVQQAVQSLQDGNFRSALEFADQAIAIEPSHAEAFVMRGIALAQAGQPDAATESLRRAIALDPRNAKAYYNLATHRYQLGEIQEAKALAEEALRIEPTHAAALDLLARIEEERNSATRVAPPPASPPQSAGQPGAWPSEGTPPLQDRPQSAYDQAGGYYVRPGYEPRHGAVGFVDRLGKTWPAIGWLLSAVSLTLTVIVFTVGIRALEMIFQPGVTPEQLQRELQATLGGFAGGVNLVGIVVLVLTFFWVVTDLVDRRGNFAWLVAFIPCTCLGLQWLVLPIYLLVGRKVQTRS